jgi:cob(I)alamin adenosyltransferase
VRIYTRRGDAGKTDTYSGERVPKDAAIVAVYGVLDELNAAVGMAAAFISWVQAPLDDVARLLTLVQNQLFALGAALSSSDGATDQWQSVVTTVEEWIDSLSAQVPPLQHFILPGGSPVGAQLHVARTIARRAERCLAAYADEQAVPPAIAAYLNRISDLLFVLARYANHRTGHAESLWQPQEKRDKI